MNQILVSEKVYVTPNMKRKKKFFKVEFFLSVFLVCLLSSYYIYAEYDRNKSEQVSKEILADMTIEEPEEKLESIVVILNSAFQEEQEVSITEAPEEIPSVQLATASDGTTYYTIGRIYIPKINVDYPILSETTVELLKISPCKFWGADPNQVGNFCIVGHNYRNTKFFSKVPTLEYGDIIEITDLSGKTVKYSVYDKHEVDPDDTSDTTQLTNGRTEITLITCTNDSKRRVIIKATAIN
ncbi:MAG: sortase [Clostridia bacterium]